MAEGFISEKNKKKIEEDIDEATKNKKEKMIHRFNNIVSSRRSKIFVIITGIMLLPWGVFALINWQEIVDVRHVDDLGEKLEWIGGVGLGYIVIFGFTFIVISILFTLVFCAGFTSYFRKLSVNSLGYIKPAIYNVISIMPMIWLLTWIVYIEKMSFTLLVIVSWCLILISMTERPLNRFNRKFTLLQLIKRKKNE